MILLIIVMIVQIIIVMHLINNKKEIKEELILIEQEKEQNKEETANSIEKVRERNKFYTVSACVDKYLSYLYEKDTEVLYNYLDIEYIEKNEITKNNILQKLDQIDTYKTFTAKEMYKQEITDKITKYYAYGVIKEEVPNGEPEEEDFYITIKIDSENETFSVLPNTYIN